MSKKIIILTVILFLAALICNGFLVGDKEATICYSMILCNGNIINNYSIYVFMVGTMIFIYTFLVIYIIFKDKI